MRIVPKKHIRYPIALERQYAREIVEHVKDLMAIVNAFKPEIRRMLDDTNIAFDADDGSALSRMMEKIASAISRLPSMRDRVERMFGKVRSHAERQSRTVFESVFGSMPMATTDEQIKREERFAQLKTLWVNENLDLIKSIDAETMRKIRENLADRIMGTVDRWRLTRELSADIEHIAHVERNRAILIGRDQVGKLNGRITEYQQRQAGVDSYIWRTAGDERVRDSHRARNGREFKWNDPPSDGHPGQPIQCRCVADPVIDVDKIGMQPKPGTFTTPLENKSAADVQTFVEMQQYFQAKYGVPIDNDVGKLLFRFTKPVFTGLDRIFQEFPSAVGVLEKIGVLNSGVMCTNHDIDGADINFNPKYFNGNPALRKMKMGNRTGFHPKNTYLAECGGHEFGHAIENYMLRRESTVGILARIRTHEYAKDVVKRAVARARREPEGKSEGKNKTIKALRSEISEYALKNMAETMPEAIGDYMANGGNAAILSRKIWEILKEEVT